jgi:HD-GYP domain-containing protein (c-di-GMP phosphodiesterase class II)
VSPLFGVHRVSLFDMVIALSGCLDLVSPVVVNHHKRVAYTALTIAEALGLPGDLRHELCIAALLHDSGALSAQERIDVLEFDLRNPREHAEMGYRLYKDFGRFAGPARLIRDHHTPWGEAGDQIPIGCHIIHLSDRVDVLIDREQPILGQVDSILEKIKARKGTLFRPDVVDILEKLAEKPVFWLDMVSADIFDILSKKLTFRTVLLDGPGLNKLAKLFSHIIDFRSPFTSTHSAGVAATSKALAQLMSFSPWECEMMQTAGYLHDLGKLAIPKEILDKPAPLNDEEYILIKSHTYYTYRVLDLIPGLELIKTWGAFHHERLDGQGYPFGITGEGIPLGSRIMAVADVFTAITEDRPYRAGMEAEAAQRVLHQMAQGGALDGEVVQLLVENFDHIDAIRAEAQREAFEAYSLSQGEN